MLTFLFSIGEALPNVETKDADDGRRGRKRARMLKELDGLLEDNAGKSERDRSTIWRKIQKFLARNDEIANE